MLSTLFSELIQIFQLPLYLSCCGNQSMPFFSFYSPIFPSLSSIIKPCHKFNYAAVMPKPVVLAKCIMQHIQVSELKKHLSRYLVCVTVHSSIINYVLFLIHLSIIVTKDYYLLHVRDTSNLQSLLARKSGYNDRVRN